MTGFASVALAGWGTLAEVTCFEGTCLPAGARVDVVDGRLQEARFAGAVRACGTELRGDAGRPVHLRARDEGWGVSGFTDGTEIEGMPVRGWLSCVDSDPPRWGRGVLAGPAVFRGWALPAGFEVGVSGGSWEFADATAQGRAARAIAASDGLVEARSMSGGTDSCGAEWASAMGIDEVERGGLTFVGAVDWRRRGEVEITGGQLARPARFGPLDVPAGSTIRVRAETPLSASGDLRFGPWRVEAVEARFGLPPWSGEHSGEGEGCRVWTDAPTGWALRVPRCPTCRGWRQSPEAVWVYVDAGGLPVDYESAWILRDPSARCTCRRLRRP